MTKLQQTLMQQLKQSNPPAFNFINNARQAGSNPEQLVNKILKEQNITGTKLDEFKTQLKGMGVPIEILNKLG